MAKLSLERRTELFRLAVMHHQAATRQVERIEQAGRGMRAASENSMFPGRVPPSVQEWRKIEYLFESEMFFLLIAMDMMCKSLNALGLSGIRQQIVTDIRDLRDYYTHFVDDPAGAAFRKHAARYPGGSPDQVEVGFNDEIAIGAGRLTLAELRAALDSIGNKLPRYEKLIRTTPTDSER